MFETVDTSGLLYPEHLVIGSISYRLPFIACVINLPCIFLPITWNCRIFSFILWSGMSYVRTLTICLLLVYFVSAAECYCFDSLVLARNVLERYDSVPMWTGPKTGPVWTVNFSVSKIRPVTITVQYHSRVNIAIMRTRGGGGAHVKILTGMLVLIFWVWNLAKSYFSRLANFSAMFLGFTKFPLFFGSDKIPAIFVGLPIFVSQNWILWMENTQYWKTKS